MPHMSDTDSTYSMNPRTARPSALGDLRFAGTIAAGLVAGTLGLGALATPLVGWKDWPSALTQQANGQPVVLAKAATKVRSEQTPRKGRPTPGGASALDNVGFPGPSTGGSGNGPGAASLPGGLATLINTPSPGGASTPAKKDRRTPSDSTIVGASTPANGDATYTNPTAFTDTGADTDDNKVPDSFQNNVPLGATRVSDGAVVGPTPDAHVVVFEVVPDSARSHTKGDPFGQTNYGF